MPKRALALLIILTVIATLLIGINIGKQLGISQYLALNAPTPSIFLTPTIIPTLTPQIAQGFKLYSDPDCGYEFQYRGSYKLSKNEKYASVMITDTQNPESPTLVATCQEEIPRPPLDTEKIEAITLDGIQTSLYHDASQKDGTPRDEIIVKHPQKNLEIIIAGFGPPFNEATSSFKFLR